MYSFDLQGPNSVVGRIMRQNNTSLFTDIQSTAGVTAFTEALATHRFEIHGNIMEVDTLPKLLQHLRSEQAKERVLAKTFVEIISAMVKQLRLSNFTNGERSL